MNSFSCRSDRSLRPIPTSPYYELVDGTADGGAAALIAASSTAAAARTESNSATPLVLVDFYFTATVGGPASGQLDAVILFEHRGTL